MNDPICKCGHPASDHDAGPWGCDAVGECTCELSLLDVYREAGSPQALNFLQERYDALFDLYVEHIHEHRLGVGKKCDECIQKVNSRIDAELENRRKAKP